MSFKYSCFKEDIYLHYGMPHEPIKRAILGTTFEDPAYEIVREDSGVFSIEYVLGGECVIQHDKKIFTVKEGDFFMLHRHSYHHYYSNPNNPCKKLFFCIEHGTEFVKHLIDDYNLSGVLHVPGFNDPTCWERCISAAMKKEPNFAKLFQLSIHQILADVSEKVAYLENNQLFTVNTLKDFLERNVMMRISLDDCCEVVGLEKTQLTTLFKKTFDKSPITYFIELKISAAKTMLEKTNASIAEIARTYAFYDQYHFSNTFKKYTGVSPTEYRKRLGKIN